MNVIFIGDVVGKGGREAVRRLLPELRREFNAPFAIVNGENSAAGSGMTAGCVNELLTVADAVTSGDHVWDQKGFDLDVPALDKLVRPANLAECQPGKGCRIFQNPLGGEIAVISLMGKVFMRESAFCPFATALKVVAELPSRVKVIFVDFHAEATSEEIAMAELLAGKVTAVLGTHTHVQTADARIIAPGTAAISDAGMAGGKFSVLGREIPAVLKKFTTGMPVRLPVVEKGIIKVDGCVVSCDAATGRASAITPFSRETEI